MKIYIDLVYLFCAVTFGRLALGKHSSQNEDFGLTDDFRSNVRKTETTSLVFNVPAWHPESEAHIRGLHLLIGGIFGSTQSDPSPSFGTPLQIVQKVLKETGKALPSAGPVNTDDVYRAEAVATKALLEAMKESGVLERLTEQADAVAVPIPDAAIVDPAELNPIVPGAGISNLAPPLPDDTVISPEPTPEPTEPPDELQQKLDYWAAQNITARFYEFIAAASPPIDSTKGINDVTAKLQAIIPQEVRDAIVESTPNIGKHDLYEAMNTAWQNYVAQSNAVKENSLAREYLEAPREAARIYNEYALWRYEAPWEVYDAKVLAKQQIRQPLRDDRIAWIEKRDELLEAKNEKTQQFWAPAVKIAIANRNQLQQAVDAKNEVANDLILSEYGTALEAIRASNDIKYILRTVILSGVIICVLNPDCCTTIEACPPTSIEQPF